MKGRELQMKDKLTKHNQKKGHYSRKNYLVVTFVALTLFSAATIPFSVALTRALSNTTQQNNN